VGCQRYAELLRSRYANPEQHHAIQAVTLTPPSRRPNPYRHRPGRLPAARRSHRSAHRRLAQPSTILRFVLPNYRLRQRQCYSKWCPIPRRLQEHRPRHPRRHPRQNEHLHRPRPNRLRRRPLQDPRQLKVHWSGCFGRSRRKAGDRCTFASFFIQSAWRYELTFATDSIHSRLWRWCQHHSPDFGRFHVQIFWCCSHYDFVGWWRLLGCEVRTVWWLWIYWVHYLRCKFFE
jgi:hypothetical protein